MGGGGPLYIPGGGGPPGPIGGGGASDISNPEKWFKNMKYFSKFYVSVIWTYQVPCLAGNFGKADDYILLRRHLEAYLAGREVLNYLEKHPGKKAVWEIENQRSLDE